MDTADSEDTRRHGEDCADVHDEPETEACRLITLAAAGPPLGDGEKAALRARIESILSERVTEEDRAFYMRMLERDVLKKSSSTP